MKTETSGNGGDISSVRATSQKIVNFFPRSKLEERRVSQICVKAGVMNVRGEGYEFIPAVDSIIAHYKTSYESHDEAGREDRARKNKAEADSAELDAIRAKGETCLMSAAKIFASEVRISLRQVIERASYLTEVQKKKLLSEIAAEKFKLPDKES